MSVDDWLGLHTSKQISELIEFHKRWPIGWQQTARICMVMAAAMGLKKSDGSKFKDEDFYPFSVERPMSDDAISSKLLSMAKKRKKKK